MFSQRGIGAAPYGQILGMSGLAEFFMKFIFGLEADGIQVHRPIRELALGGLGSQLRHGTGLGRSEEERVAELGLDGMSDQAPAPQVRFRR